MELPGSSGVSNPARAGPTETVHVTRHYPAYHSDYRLDRRVADLAVQIRLGLLPERRRRPDRADPHHPAADGTHLAALRGRQAGEQRGRLAVERRDERHVLGMMLAHVGREQARVARGVAAPRIDKVGLRDVAQGP